MRSFYARRVSLACRRLLLRLGGHVYLGTSNRAWAYSPGQTYRGHRLTAFVPAVPDDPGGVFETAFPMELWGKARRGNRG